MSILEPTELPRRPNKIQVYGQHEDTILMMHEKHGHQLLVEKIDDRLYELTICVYSHEKPDDKKQKRVEYVLHTNEAVLRMLVNQIKEALDI